MNIKIIHVIQSHLINAPFNHSILHMFYPFCKGTGHMTCSNRRKVRPRKVEPNVCLNIGCPSMPPIDILHILHCRDLSFVVQGECNSSVCKSEIALVMHKCDHTSVTTYTKMLKKTSIFLVLKCFSKADTSRERGAANVYTRTGLPF